MTSVKYEEQLQISYTSKIDHARYIIFVNTQYDENNEHKYCVLDKSDNKIWGCDTPAEVKELICS